MNITDVERSLPRVRGRDHGAGLVIVCILTTAAAGCQVKAPPHMLDETIQSKADLSFTPLQILLRMRSLVEPLTGAIVESADRIGAATDDAAVRREALVWKIEAVPAMRVALFRSNPYVAVMDSWVLTWQMHDYFETGRGREALGDAAPIAVATCSDLENEIHRVAASLTVSGDVSKAAEFARKWSREHPIRYSIASRESTLSRVGERQLIEKLTTSQLAGNVTVTLDDLTRRLDILSAQLPEQSRWQAELFAMDLAGEYQLEKAMPLAETAVDSVTEAMDAVQELLPSVADTLTVVQSTPELVRRERQAAVQALAAEITRVMEFAREERLATLEQLAIERETVLSEMQRTVATERNALTDDVEQIAAGLVDHAMIRVAQLAAGVLVAVFVGAIVLLFLTRRIFAPRGIA